MAGVSAYTRPCPGCGQSVLVHQLDPEMLNAWKDGRILIQDAFPTMTPSLRERFVTGYCPKCWDEMFPPEVVIA